MKRTIRDIAAEYGYELPDCKGAPCIFGPSPCMHTNGSCRCGGKEPGTLQIRRAAMMLVRLCMELDARLHDTEGGRGE